MPEGLDILHEHRHRFYVGVSQIGSVLQRLAGRNVEAAAMRIYDEADRFDEQGNAARARYLRLWGDRVVTGRDGPAVPRTASSTGASDPSAPGPDAPTHGKRGS